MFLSSQWLPGSRALTCLRAGRPAGSSPVNRAATPITLYRPHLQPESTGSPAESCRIPITGRRVPRCRPARRGAVRTIVARSRRGWRGRHSAARPSRRLIYGLDMPEITNMIIMELNERALAVSVGPLGLQNTASDVKLWHHRTATRPICTQSNAKMSNTPANIIGN